MTSPMISVLVPAYNAQNTIEKCLASILVENRLDLEVIVIDDGSADETLAICQKLRDSSGQRVRVESQANQGPSAARNRGLELAEGKYILFLDADDWLEPGALWALFNSVERTGVDAIRAGYRMVYADSSVRDGALRMRPGMYEGRDAVDEVRVALASGLEQGFAWLWLLTRSSVGNTRFRREISYMEDLVFLIEVLQRCQRVEVTSVCLVNYRQIEGSLARSPERFIENTLQTFGVLALLTPETPESQGSLFSREVGVIISGRLEQIARSVCFEIEAARMNRREFGEFAEAARNSPAFQQQIQRAQMSRRYVALPLLKAVARSHDRLAWIYASAQAYAWRLYRAVRK